MSRMRKAPQSTVQQQIQDDWVNREYIEVITTNIKKIAGFLNSFGKFSLFQFSVIVKLWKYVLFFN